MFSLIDPTETDKVSILTCQNLWEYTDFVKDVECIIDICDVRNTLLAHRNMNERNISTRERRVNARVTLSDDYYIQVFMPVCTPERSFFDQLRLIDTYIFNTNKIIGNKITTRVGSAVETTDYISCVFVRKFPENVYTRNDTTVSGRSKLNVKS